MSKKTGKFEGLVEFLNVQVVEHRYSMKAYKEPVYAVVLENLANKKDKIKREGPTEGLFTAYPLTWKFSIEVKTPQTALSDYTEEEKKPVSATATAK